ncbi:MAG: DUF3147 family protein [Pseudomonadota bacterium]
MSGYVLLKVLISAILVAAVSEISKRFPGIGALIASLPLISILAMIWLWRDTGDTARIADHSAATFWYVLPSLPMFLVLPFLLRSGLHFFVALPAVIALTVVLYALMTVALLRFGIKL